jgi:hypothetical protein
MVKFRGEFGYLNKTLHWSVPPYQSVPLLPFHVSHPVWKKKMKSMVRRWGHMNVELTGTLVDLYLIPLVQSLHQ